MGEIVDARGLSCPQPVLLTLSKLKEVETGTLKVIVDNETSRENVSRTAMSQGWKVVSIKEEGDDFFLELNRS